MDNEIAFLEVLGLVSVVCVNARDHSFDAGALAGLLGMTTAPVLYKSTHLANYLLRVVQYAYGREVLVDARHVDGREVDIVVRDEAVVQARCVAVLDVLDHSSMQFETILAGTSVSVRANNCVILILHRIGATVTLVFQVLKFSLILANLIMSFIERRQIIVLMRNLVCPFKYLVNRIIDGVVLILANGCL